MAQIGSDEKKDDSNLSLMSTDSIDYGDDRIRFEWVKIKEIHQKANTNPNFNKYDKSKQVKMVKNNHKQANSVKENRVVHDQISLADGSGLTALGAVGFYVVDLAIEQAFMSTIGAELAYAAGIGAWGGLAGIGVAVATAGVIHLMQKSSDAKHSKQKQFNTKAKLFNEQNELLTQQCKEMAKLKDELSTHEKKLNKSNSLKNVQFAAQFGKSIMLVGPTGFGKSLVANRIMGNKQDILDISDRELTNGDFKVAEIGGAESETNELKKVTKQVLVLEDAEGIQISDGDGDSDDDEPGSSSSTPGTRELTLLDTFNISVIDTPGAFDSNGNSIYYQNEMSEFCKQIGGVNMFAIFFRFQDKMDEKYKKLMKEYENYWGKNMWNQCIIIITRCDKDSKKNIKRCEKGLPKTILQIKEDLREISNGRFRENTPILCFGEENYEDSIKELFCLLNDDKQPFADKFKCDHIKSPMDDKWDKLITQRKKVMQTVKRMNRLKIELDALKKEIK